MFFCLVKELKGTGKKILGGGGGGGQRVGRSREGWFMMFLALCKGWVTLFYYIDRNTFKY